MKSWIHQSLNQCPWKRSNQSRVSPSHSELRIYFWSHWTQFLQCPRIWHTGNFLDSSSKIRCPWAGQTWCHFLSWYSFASGNAWTFRLAVQTLEESASFHGVLCNGFWHLWNKFNLFKFLLRSQLKREFISRASAIDGQTKATSMPKRCCPPFVGG